jgi:uncharacterized protein YdeI (YjbR/CyaY-like superfamily)
MKRTNPKVDDFLRKAETWREALEALRKIVLDRRLTEQWKWGAPCYTFQKSNVVILARLKECCAISFFKGALLNDAHGVLVKPGENTRAARLIRFGGVREIVEMEPILKAYVDEAIQVEKAGLKVDFSENAELAIPDEFQNRLIELPALKTAFFALTPGRQRAYLLHFSAAKQSKTRASRIAKHIPRILDGKGVNDCTCGRSQKPPYCDGSHNLP